MKQLTTVCSRDFRCEWVVWPDRYLMITPKQHF